MFHRVTFTFLVVFLVAVSSAEDSLQGALDAVYRRERDLGYQGYDNYGNWNDDPYDLATKYETRKAELERALFDYLDNQQDYTDQEEPNVAPSPFRERAEKSKSLIHSKSAKSLKSFRDPKNDYPELLEKYSDYDESPMQNPQLYKRYNDYNYNSLGYNSIGLRKRTYGRNGFYLDDLPQYYKPRERRVPFYPVTKRFPVKRSSGNNPNTKRSTDKQTDPKVEKELSQLFSSNGKTKSITKRAKFEPVEDKSISHKKPSITTEKPRKESGVKPTIKAAETDHEENINKEVVNHEHEHHHDQKSNGSEDNKGQEHVDQHNQKLSNEEEEKPLQMKKKSIKWSDYFGLDRRKKSTAMDNEWLMDRYNKANDITKKSSQHLHSHKSEESNAKDSIQKLDEKLKDIEESIIDDTLKFAGAHDDVDSKEMRDVKDSIIARLATAYNVEKMRKALNEYRQSLELRGNDWDGSEDDINEEKRVAVPRKQAVELDRIKEDPAEDNRIKCTDTDVNCIEQNFKAPWEIMEQATFDRGGCDRIERACRDISVEMGPYAKMFETACNMHQMCMICSDNNWFSPTRQCNILFLSKADQLCDGTLNCKRAFRESIKYLEYVNRSMRSDLDSACHLECPDKR